MTTGIPQPADSNAERDALLEFFISDTLSNDEETPAQILSDLNYAEHGSYRDDWGRPFIRLDVFRGVIRLLQSGRVRVFDDRKHEVESSRLENADSIEDLWFQLTDVGMEAHSKWTTTS